MLLLSCSLCELTSTDDYCIPPQNFAPGGPNSQWSQVRHSFASVHIVNLVPTSEPEPLGLHCQLFGCSQSHGVTGLLPAPHTLCVCKFHRHTQFQHQTGVRSTGGAMQCTEHNSEPASLVFHNFTIFQIETFRNHKVSDWSGT